MNTSEKLIKDIYWQVWYFNSSHDKYEDWETELSKDPAEIAPIIKNYCESIIKAKSETSAVVKDAIENIYKYCRPANYAESSMNVIYKHEVGTDKESRLRDMPKWIASVILEYINELIDATKSEADVSLQELNKKWCHKWLYFNGDESGQQIIRINKIHYITDEYSENPQLAFDGSIIEFFNENSSYGGIGVKVDTVENELFANLYYIDYIEEGLYNYEENNDEEYSEEWSDPNKLEAALSSKPIDTSLKSRILSDDEMKNYINIQFFGDYGAIQEKCYDR